MMQFNDPQYCRYLLLSGARGDTGIFGRRPQIPSDLQNGHEPR